MCVCVCVCDEDDDNRVCFSEDLQLWECVEQDELNKRLFVLNRMSEIKGYLFYEFPLSVWCVCVCCVIHV